jgi:hypothetical protein
LLDGTVLVAGGVEYGPEAENPTEYLNNYSERYDPASDAWLELAVMIETPFAHAASILNDGTVLVMGGRAVATYRNSVRYLSNFRTGGDYPPVWHSTAELLQARSNHQSTLLNDGTVLVTGGFIDCIDRTNPPGGCSASLDTVELYHTDPNSLVAGRWENKEIMFNRRGDHTATLLPNGSVLVCGGYTWAGGGALDSAEIFYPQGRPQ